MASNQAAAQVTPEIEPVTTSLLSPLLKDPKFIAAIAGVAILLAIFTVLRPSRRISRKGGVPTVLLVGPSDSGKTSLFAKLVHNSYPQTHTSIIPSITTFSLPTETGRVKQIRLVDLPGHPRLRDEFKKHVAEAAAVVFVVDIVGLVRNAGAVAEQLPPILSALANVSVRLPPSSPPPKVLLLAHKADLLIRPAPSVSSCPPDLPPQIIETATERIKSILTREMERLKAARGAGGAGGRIEGMGKVTGGSGGGFFGRLFGLGGGVTETEGEAEDEEGLIWGGRGAFRWEDVEGVEIYWGASALGSVSSAATAEEKSAEDGNGLEQLNEILSDI